MVVTIRLFARLRELAGAAELPRDVSPGATARSVWDTLVGDYPDLAPYTSSISCAVNEEYARWTTGLEDGDEIAFLPPVSGG